MTEADDSTGGSLLSVRVGMVPIAADDEDNGFHVQNTSLSDWQRDAVIERKGAMDIRCDLVGVLHGWYGKKSDSGPFATVMVFKFKFDPQKHSRRIIRCKTSVEFWSTGARPEVTTISPYDKFDLLPTEDEEDIKEALKMKLGLSGVPHLNASISGKFERSRKKHKSDAATISGNISLPPGVNSGKRNCADWTLLENDSRKSGLPDSLRVAILLKRLDQKPFQGVVRMSCRADFTTELGLVFWQISTGRSCFVQPNS